MTRSKTTILHGLYATLMVLSAVVFTFGQKDDGLARVIAEIDNGTVKGNVYENRVLGLRLKFPSSMEADSKDDVAKDLKEGIELLKKSGASQSRIDDMIRKERIVLALSIKPDEDTIGALSLTIKKDDTSDDLKPMVDRSVKFFTSGGKFKLHEAAKAATYGPIKGISFVLWMEEQGTRIFSKNFATRRNGYLLTFSMSYIDETGLSKMEAVLEKMETL